MKKNYTPEQLLKMAVKSIAVDPGADLDGDGRITAADAAQAAGASSAEAVPPAYTYQPNEKYTAARENVLSQLLENSGSTGMDINADRLYDQYRQLYEKNAALSAEHTYGLLSRGTGGYGSSYAASAAAAAYNSYMEGLADRATELERLNLDKTAAQEKSRQNALSALNALDQTDYNRFEDRLSLAFDAAKQGDYSLMEDMDLSTAALRRSDVRALADYAAEYGDDSFLRAMGIDTSSRTDARAYAQAAQAAEYGDYSYLQRLGVDISSLTQARAFSQAAQAAQYGDYSYLRALGVDTSQMQYNALLKTAAEIAQFGDYSALEQLGVDVDRLIENEQFDRAVALAKYGDFSLLGNFTDNAENLRQKVNYTIQRGAEEAYAYGGYEALWDYVYRQVGYGQLNEASARQVLAAVTGG